MQNTAGACRAFLRRISIAVQELGHRDNSPDAETIAAVINMLHRRLTRGPADRGCTLLLQVNEAVIGGPAPRVGEHSHEVLRELGYSDGAIDKMVADKAVRVASN